MRAKKDQLVDALSERFGAHHAVVARQILDHISFLDASIDRLTTEIVERMRPFEPELGWNAPQRGIAQAAKRAGRSPAWATGDPQGATRLAST